MAVGKPNGYDQRLQTVMLLLNTLEGTGVDGRKGDGTTGSLNKTSIALGMGPIKSSEDSFKVQQALMAKLKDPQFLENALAKLKEMPQNKDTIAAMQVVLVAAGHPLQRDVVTGMVSGKMDGATKFALENTVNGRPNERAYAAGGLPPETAQYVANLDRSMMNQNFANAVVPPAAAPTVVAAVPSTVAQINRNMTN